MVSVCIGAPCLFIALLVVFHTCARTSTISVHLITVFGVGNMVYDGLLLQQLQSKDSTCLAGSFIWPYYVHLVFFLVQTYFIFKHPQVGFEEAATLPVFKETFENMERFLAINPEVLTAEHDELEMRFWKEYIFVSRGNRG